jgi:hypothetical protein
MALNFQLTMLIYVNNVVILNNVTLLAKKIGVDQRIQMTKTETESAGPCMTQAKIFCTNLHFQKHPRRTLSANVVFNSGSEL